MMDQAEFGKLVQEVGATGLQFWAVTAKQQGATDEQIQEGVKFLTADELVVATFLIVPAIVVGVGMKK